MDVRAPADESDPLAQPTRARIFQTLVELRRPASTAELAEQLGLHPNGVRGHLERLRAAGLVERNRARQSRGRPRDAWVVSPDAQPGGAAPTGFNELGRWLARAIPARRRREVEATGRAIGRDLAADAGVADIGDPLFATLVALGFQPRAERPDPDSITYCLDNCPYRDAVQENREIVCTLHRGITRGLLEGIAPAARMTDFVARDPETAGCLIEITAVAGTAIGADR